MITMDIGSTYIKMLDFNAAAPAVVTQPRRKGTDIDVQLRELVGYRFGKQPLRISSSANGGLAVGILCLTSRVSGRAAAGVALTAGGNVSYVHMLQDLPSRLSSTDVVLIVGGTDNAGHKALKDTVRETLARDLNTQIVIYAGAREAAPPASDAVTVVPNLFEDSLVPNGEALREKLEALYLNDLVHKAFIDRIRDVAQAPILPTPAVVNLIYGRYMAGSAICPVADPPFLLVDIGGATTDIYTTIDMYGTDGSRALDLLPNTLRRVFVDLGVAASRANMMARLFNHPKRLEFLKRMATQHEISPLETLEVGDVPDPVAFAACLFLALDSMTGQDNKLQLDRVQTVLITGGGSQIDMEEEARIVLDILAPKTAMQLAFDSDYRIWAEGLRAEHEETPTHHNAAMAT
jgi:hypothetical protein